MNKQLRNNMLPEHIPVGSVVEWAYSKLSGNQEMVTGNATIKGHLWTDLDNWLFIANEPDTIFGGSDNLTLSWQFITKIVSRGNGGTTDLRCPDWIKERTKNHRERTHDIMMRYPNNKAKNHYMAYSLDGLLRQVVATVPEFHKYITRQDLLLEMDVKKILPYVHDIMRMSDDEWIFTVPKKAFIKRLRRALPRMLMNHKVVLREMYKQEQERMDAEFERDFDMFD